MTFYSLILLHLPDFHLGQGTATTKFEQIMVVNKIHTVVAISISLLIFSTPCVSSPKEEMFSDRSGDTLICPEGAESLYFEIEGGDWNSTIKWCEKDGVEHGPFKIYENGWTDLGKLPEKKLVDGSYLMGKKHGNWKELDLFRIEFHKGQKHGSATYWNEEGEIWKEGSYKYDCPIGPWRFFDDEGNLVSEQTLDEGNGNWISYHEDGSVEEKGAYLNCMKQGLWTRLHPSGNTLSEGKYDQDKNHGLWTYWWDGDQKFAEGYYNQGKENGKWTYWHKNGEVWHLGEYNNGRRTGKWSTWDENNVLMKEGEYLNGWRSGTWFFYGRLLESNFKKSQGSYDEGDKPLEIRWYENMGLIMSEDGWSYGGGWAGRHIVFRDHNSHIANQLGQWMMRDTHFIFSKEDKTFKSYNLENWDWDIDLKRDGISSGTWSTWHSNGQKAVEGSFENGLECGTWSRWTDDAEPMEIKEFLNSACEKTQTGAICPPCKEKIFECPKGTEPNKYSKKGNYSGFELNCCVRNEKEHGPFSAVYKKDKIQESLEGQFIDGKAVGIWTKTYNDNDQQLEWRMEYADGLKHGPATYWHPNGGQWKEGDYRLGHPVGTWNFWAEDGNVIGTLSMSKVGKNTWTSWYPNGKREMSGVYVDGLRKGLWTCWYDDGGSKLSEGEYRDGLKHGDWTYWYDDGQRAATGSYDTGKEHGKWSYWQEDSEKLAKGTFHQGRKQGVWKTYFSSLEVAEKGEYHHGWRTGHWTIYDKDQGRSEGSFKPKTMPLESRWYDEFGESSVIDRLELDEYEIWLIPKKKELGYEKLKRWLKRIEEQKDTTEEPEEEDGIRHGIWKTWDENDQIRLVKYYDIGVPCGEWSCWNAENTPMPCEYVNDPCQETVTGARCPPCGN